MDSTSQWACHVDGDMSPVILPIGLPTDAGRQTMQDACTGSGRAAAQKTEFSFPAIEPPYADEPLGNLRRVIWPKCDCTDALRAGATLAKAIRGQLPSDRSSVVALTSPVGGDGKTTLTEILAPALAKCTAGGTLVVDADFRKSDLTARLTLPAASGAADSSLIYPTDLAGLNVLPMSRQRRGCGANAEWIEGMRDNWPLTLLDMASLEHRETAPLLRHCDAVCLVVRLGHTPRRAVKEAARIIAVCGGRLLGCVVVGEAA